MKAGLIGVLAVAAALVGAVALSPQRTDAAPPQGGTFACSPFGTTIPLVCTITNFSVQNGVLYATGTVTNPANNQTIPFNVPVSNLSGTCQILHLELGPINLDLLGLMVDTNRIVVDITAQSGPGNLLGNLLCGIAGLLDGNAPLNSLVRALNQLLGLLG